MIHVTVVFFIVLSCHAIAHISTTHAQNLSLLGAGLVAFRHYRETSYTVICHAINPTRPNVSHP